MGKRIPKGDCRDRFGNCGEVSRVRDQEANRLADRLANYAFTLQQGLHIFDSLPVWVISVFDDDANGVATSRLVGL
ncbi:unnamed protein product [Cochlearia groenlandica]